MEAFLRRYTTRTYRVPAKCGLQMATSAGQIVFAWHTLQTRTPYYYVSLATCRDGIDAACPWDAIGRELCTLLDENPSRAAISRVRTIGHGNATVVLGQDAGRLVAIKQHLCHKGPWQVTAHALQELRALSRLQRYKWAPRVVFTKMLPDAVYVGMEFLPLSLKQVVVEQCDMQYVRSVFIKLLSAVSELHDKRMAHRDIKPDNIRLRSDGTLVLIDYDSCIQLRANMPRTSRVCTAPYRDPRLFEPGVDLEHYDYRCLDAFSCGAVFLYMVSRGVHAFYGRDEPAVLACMTTKLRSASWGLPRSTATRLSPTDRLALSGLLSTDLRHRLTVSAALLLYRTELTTPWCGP